MNKKYWLNKKVLITGGSGFLGKHLIRRLRDSGAKLFYPTSYQFDLREKDTCRKVVKGMDIVIHLAAKVGGIGFNQKYPGEIFYDNLTLGVHLMEEARRAKVKKFVAIGTICAYPKLTKVPFNEDDLWNGYPEETNAPYVDVLITDTEGKIISSSSKILGQEGKNLSEIGLSRLEKEKGQEKKNLGVSELDFTLSHRNPTQIVEDRTISLFTRVSFRYRKNHTQIQYLPWSLPENK